MPRRAVRVVLVLCCLAIACGAFAVQQEHAGPPQGTPASTTAPAAFQGRVFGQPLAVRIELTITDQVGTAAPSKKTISMLAADGERASVRSTNRTKDNRSSAQFSIDAKPILSQDRIRVDLSLIYDLPEVGSPDASEKDPPWMTNLAEQIGVILDNGKPLVISQSADPRTDRRVTVEVKATILK